MTSYTALSVGLFVLLFAAVEVGRWLRRCRCADGDVEGSAAAEGVVFSVLGLMLAFIFTSSASRFDERRQLIVEHANAIGTAWLRIDLLPEPDREPIRTGMRDWVKLSLEALPASGTQQNLRFESQLIEAQRLQTQTWAAAMAAVERSPRPQYASLILAPINDWIDLSSTRYEMQFRGMPPLVLTTLVGLSILGALLAGFRMGKTPKRSYLHIISFAATIALSLYVIIDLNHPRAGMIRLDAADDAMKQLYQSMNMSAPR